MKTWPLRGPQRPPTLLEAYLGNDIGKLRDDVLMRPAHYSEEERELVEDIHTGKRSLDSVDYRDLNGVFLTFCRDTEVAKAVDAAVSKTKELLEDPEEEPWRTKRPPVFEEQFEPGDKVII